MTDKSEMIFGVRAVIEAIQAGKEIDKILVKKDIQSDLSKELFAALKGLLIPVQRVPVERINRITRKNHQGVVAFISSVTYQKTEDLVPFLFEQGKNPFFVPVADGKFCHLFAGLFSCQHGSASRQRHQAHPAHRRRRPRRRQALLPPPAGVGPALKSRLLTSFDGVEGNAA